MTQTEKQRITDALRTYVGRYPSQNKAAASLNGVSAATVSAILKGNHELISDDMWRNVDKQVTPQGSQLGWRIVETTSFREIQTALADAQDFGNVRWIVGDAGCGKSTGARCYAANNDNVFVVLCDEDMRKSDFVREIARKVGLKTAGMRLREMLEGATDYLMQLESPLLIFDEGDKLNDNVIHYFINIYNRMEGCCGIAFFVDRLHRAPTGAWRGLWQKRLRGDLLAHRPPVLRARTYQHIDVEVVCEANGLTDKGQIAKVVAVARDSDYDMRVVRREIHRQKRIAAAKTAPEKQSNNG